MKLRLVVISIFTICLLLAAHVSAQDNTMTFKVSDPVAFGERHTITVGTVFVGDVNALSCVFVSGKSAVSPSVTKCFKLATVSVSQATPLPNSHVAISVFVTPIQSASLLCVFQTGEDDKANITYDCQPASS